jgi:hypothetical protein
VTDELAERRAHLEAVLRGLDAGECDSCSGWNSHLWPDEHPARWCEEMVCPFRKGPPTGHAKLVGEWARTGTTRVHTFADSGGRSSTDSRTS